MADHVNQTGSKKKSKTTQQRGSIMKKKLDLPIVVMFQAKM